MAASTSFIYWGLLLFVIAIILALFGAGNASYVASDIGRVLIVIGVIILLFVLLSQVMKPYGREVVVEGPRRNVTFAS